MRSPLVLVGRTTSFQILVGLVGRTTSRLIPVGLVGGLPASRAGWVSSRASRRTQGVCKVPALRSPQHCFDIYSAARIWKRQEWIRARAAFLGLTSASCLVVTRRCVGNCSTTSMRTPCCYGLEVQEGGQSAWSLAGVWCSARLRETSQVSPLIFVFGFAGS